MDLLSTLAMFNIITLLDLVFPKGIGELIVLLCWLGFWALMPMLGVVWALTKEQLYVNTRTRITQEEIGVLVYPGGGTKEFILPPKESTYQAHMGGKDCTWKIIATEWMTKSNGVRFTYFHPDISHNISLNTLVSILLSSQTMVYKDEEGNEAGREEFIPIRNLSMTAYSMDGKIIELAAAMADDMVDPNKKLNTAIIAVSIILALGIAGGILFTLIPHQTAQAAAEVVTTVTTTTIKQGLSKIT
jgi:hypothetical protein